MTRKACAAAIRSMAPPKRSASTAISDAPPGSAEKNAVLMSTPLSRRTTTVLSSPTTTAPRVVMATTGRCAARKLTVSGVKYRPSAAPITHCPAWRPPRTGAMCTPRMRSSATAHKGPIIHGRGRWIAVAMPPASRHTRTPSMTGQAPVRR